VGITWPSVLRPTSERHHLTMLCNTQERTQPIVDKQRVVDVCILDCTVLNDWPRGSTRELLASNISGFGSSFSIYLTAYPTIGPQAIELEVGA
jgi:hypothetical protein